ncbi:MAG: pentapeptide repeat-containing protein, partial [Amoebophilaceae bacterium]|nr:pentapeptide repeat-containing protein [Amoebophilaceae bacterium]
MKINQTLNLSTMYALLIGLVGCNSGMKPEPAATTTGSMVTTQTVESSINFPDGDYEFNCKDITFDGQLLSATCKNILSTERRVTINIKRCKIGSKIDWEISGDLSCHEKESSLPEGNYLTQCKNPHFDAVSGLITTEGCTYTGYSLHYYKPFPYYTCARGSKVDTGVNSLTCEVPDFIMGNYIMGDYANKNNYLSEKYKTNWNGQLIPAVLWSGSGYHIGDDSTFIRTQFTGGNFHDAYLGDADFTGASFTDHYNFNSYAYGTNFNGITALDGYFSYGIFSHATFRYANLVNADFSGSQSNPFHSETTQLYGDDFTGANLQNAKFSNAKIGATRFVDANLRGATFKDFAPSSLSSNSFAGADLRGIVTVSTSFSSTKLQRVNLSKTNLAHIDFRDANLTDANLTDANLTDTNLSGANLSGANLTGANFDHTHLNGANLSGANFTGVSWYKKGAVDANFHGANLSYANFTGAILNSAAFYGANLTGANFTNAWLPYIDFTGADLAGANFTGAIAYNRPDYNSANLSHANLSHVDFVGGYFYHANLSAADLTDAKFQGANFHGA